MSEQKLIPQPGGFRKLKSFQVARPARDFEQGYGFTERMVPDKKA
jgi:hypothetical protein